MMIVNHAGLSLFCGAAHFPPPLQSYSGDVHPRNLSHRWGDAACAKRRLCKESSPCPLCGISHCHKRTRRRGSCEPTPARRVTAGYQ